HPVIRVRTFEHSQPPLKGVWEGLPNWDYFIRWRATISNACPSPAASPIRMEAMLNPIFQNLRKERQPEDARKKRRKIAFFGHFNKPNCGNESTLQAILHHLRHYQPDAAVICISTGPEAIIATHQIEAIPISENLLFKSWLPQNPLLRLLRKILVGI